MSDAGSDKYREEKAKEFKRWETDKLKEHKEEIEQRVLLNSLDIMQGALWMLKREKMRHAKDIQRIEYDIMKLERMGIKLPPCLKLDLWFEIPDKDPRTHGGIK